MSAAPSPLAQATAILEEAQALDAAGRLDEAAATLERGLARFPSADGFRVALGGLHLRRGDRAAARAAFEQVRVAAPGRQDAMTGLAQVLALEGEHAQAAALYRQALAIRPDNAGARIALARCLLEMGDRAAGEAELRWAVKQASPLAGPAISALASAPHGRFFLRRSAADRFLAGEAG